MKTNIWQRKLNKHFKDRLLDGSRKKWVDSAERKSKDGDGVSSGFRAKVNNSLGVNRKGAEGGEGAEGKMEALKSICC